MTAWATPPWRAATDLVVMLKKYRYRHPAFKIYIHSLRCASHQTIVFHSKPKCASDKSRGIPMDIFKIASKIFESQPFSKYMQAELVSMGENEAVMHLPITENMKQQHGFAHGGVISYLADNSITFAGGIALGGDALTSEYKINYVRPATGSHLIARARAHSVGKRQAVCIAEIYAVQDGAEKLCAIAQGTVVKKT
jgi:acyl-CoA thioesterase